MATKKPRNIVVHMRQLRAMPGNPKSRSKHDAHGLTHNSALSKSIEKHYCFYPPLVVDSGLKVEIAGKLKPIYIVCDGHRRRWSHKTLGRKTIEVRELPCMDGMTPRATAREIWKEANTTHKTLNDCDHLDTWMVNPILVSERRRNRYHRMETEFGRDILKEVVNTRSSTHKLELAIRVHDEFLGFKNMRRRRKEKLIDVWRWVKGKSTQIRDIISGENPDMDPDELMKSKKERLKESYENGRSLIW